MGQIQTFTLFCELTSTHSKHFKKRHHTVDTKALSHTAAAQPQRRKLSSRTYRNVKMGVKVFFKVNIPGTFTHEKEADANTKTALPIISDA